MVSVATNRTGDAAQLSLHQTGQLTKFHHESFPVCERFRFVPLVRTLRYAQWPAVILGLAFAVVSLVANPLWAVTALLVGFLLTILGQFRMLSSGANYQALMRGLMPTLVLGMFVVNYPGLLPATFPHLQFGFLETIAALLLAASYWFVAHQRTKQDLIRLRD